MDGAYNSTTKKYLLAINLELDPSYQFPKNEIWYADPNTIESYDKNKIKDITKIEVRYRKGNDSVINWKGTEYAIAPCFFIQNKSELGINLIPETKEHKLTKNWIYNRIKNKNLIFSYSKVNKPYEYDNEISIEELDISYNKVGIEITVINNKVQRADIIIPFKKYHKLFGTGIVVEIQFSKQYNFTTEKRSKDWAFKGYSICWLWKEDFEEINESMIELKEDKLKLEPLTKILNDYVDKTSNKIRLQFQELSRSIDRKMDELNYPFIIGECKVCNKGYMNKKQNKTTKSYFYSCSNWRFGCKHSIPIPKGESND